MKNLQIRPSQFITTYGVGAIVDGPEGSAIILDFSKSQLFRGEKRPEDPFIISVPGASRISKRIAYNHDDLQVEKIGIFRLPTNDDLPYGNNEPIYAIKPFPGWSLCHSPHSGGYQVLYRRNKVIQGKMVCPVCANDKKKFRSFTKYQSNLEVIRFIRACPRGHIDDVNWFYAIHGDYSTSSHSKCKEPDYYEYIDAGSELQFVKIRCPNCTRETTLKNIIKNEVPCTGRVPFMEDPLFLRTGGNERQRCDINSLVLQRTASSVFVPQVITSIALPEEANIFYPILNFVLILPIIRRYQRRHGLPIPFDEIYFEFDDWNQDSLMLSNHPRIKDYLQILNRIKNDPSQKPIAQKIINYFVEEILGSTTPYDENLLRMDEYNAFREQRQSLDIDKGLEIGIPLYFDYQGPNKKLRFKVTPIIQLEALMVQQGFYRYINVKKKQRSPSTISLSEDEYEENTLFPTPYIDGDKIQWYVGAKLRGEGIFIELEDELDFNLDEENEKFWENIRKDLIKLKINEKDIKNQEETNKNLLDQELGINLKRYEWLTLFQRRGFEMFINLQGIWWHTLSHRFIKALGLDCGYSSSSLRERLYIDIEKNKGGILIYASRPGEDGTLGGLVSQVHRFDKIIQLALDDIDSCSNDPICVSKKFYEPAINGAACYTCVFLSETSCEFGNIGLDRNLILDTI